MGTRKKPQASTSSSLLEKPAYNVADLVDMGIMSRTQAYMEHRAGRLDFKKMGKRTLILREELHRYLDELPSK